MNIIGFDFSINKPAATIFSNDKYYFYIWPFNLSEKYSNLFKTSGVNVIKRTDEKEEKNDLSSKMRYEIENSTYLSKLIVETLVSYLNKETLISFEGLSYASSGDIGLQLSAYKYMLMLELSKFVPLSNMFTYSPMTIKSIAGCSKKGMKKIEMINAFIKNGPMCKFRVSLFEKREFMKKGGKSWIDNVDDIVDSYFAIKTLQVKELPVLV